MEAKKREGKRRSRSNENDVNEGRDVEIWKEYVSWKGVRKETGTKVGPERSKDGKRGSSEIGGKGRKKK